MPSQRGQSHNPNTVYKRTRARMVRLWNLGDHSLSDIARDTGVSIGKVAKYLTTRPGYPGLIGATKMACRLCGAQFEVWGQGARSRRYCSTVCGQEARRREWFRRARIARGQSLPDVMPPRKFRRAGGGMSAADRAICEAARLEARERGVDRETILREWKFEPQRNAQRRERFPENNSSAKPSGTDCESPA